MAGQDLALPVGCCGGRPQGWPGRRRSPARSASTCSTIARQRRLAVLVTVLVLSLSACSRSTRAVPPVPHSFAPGVVPGPSKGASGEYGRSTIADLEQLALPIMFCIDQHDTDNPAFHGCVDWHSAVHATFALFVISRLTRDLRYRDTAERAVGGQTNIAMAVDELKAGTLADELPYGYGWSLILDAEARIEGDPEFNRLASVTSAALVRWLSTTTSREIVYDAISQDYSNTSWPVICLLIWARIAHQPADAALAMHLARYLLAEPEQSRVCDSSGGGTVGFFAPCSLLALTAWLSGESAGASQRILAQMAQYRALPEVSPWTAHSSGVGFSRSWGDIAAYELTGLPLWSQRFQRLFDYEMKLNNIWAGNYYLYAHWVAQFGVFAVWLEGLARLLEPAQ